MLARAFWAAIADCCWRERILSWVDGWSSRLVRSIDWVGGIELVIESEG